MTPISQPTNPIEAFREEVQGNITRMGEDSAFNKLSQHWFSESVKQKYCYNFSWMGRPIIQHPQDIIGLQEVIWEVQPDLIIETGVAHGGSLIFSASMLALLGGDRHVVGVDIDIRAHNRQAIEAHPMFKQITLLEGSSTSSDIIEQVKAIAQNYQKIMVILDSNHTHDHVLEELALYSPFVQAGSYLLVFDTVVEDVADGVITDRPWHKGSNPKTAVWEFINNNPQRFVIDERIPHKLQLTCAPDGWLRCINDSN